MGCGAKLRCCFFIDAGQHSVWTEYLDIPPVAGDVIEHGGCSYIVNPNPVHTWFEHSEAMLMFTLTTVNARSR
jgi:hypothetical protein